MQRFETIVLGLGATGTAALCQLARELEQETGSTLLTSNGCLIISSRAKSSITHVEGFFATTLAAAQRYGIAHELLTAEQIQRRFPQFKVADDEVGYLERDGGFVRPEACIRAQLT